MSLSIESQAANLAICPGQGDGLVTLDGIDWDQFKLLERIFGDRRYPKLTFLEGTLEIMAPPSAAHEAIKSTLPLLLETYLQSRRLRFYRRGSLRLQQEGTAAGEPDESYCIGENRETPDLVIEVILTAGSLDKLAVYRPHRVPEVWFWKDGAISVFRLQGGDYARAEKSGLLPELDLRLLEACLAEGDQYDAVQHFRERI